MYTPDKYEWVSVKSMLPPTPGEHYLTWMQVGDTGTLVENIYLGEGQWTVMTNRVTHWMDMPEPPEIAKPVHEQCPQCGGVGYVPVGEYTSLRNMHIRFCPKCSGMGTIRRSK